MKELTCETLVSIKQILFATDFSHSSARALPYALAIAEKYGAKLYAAHITPEPIGLPAAVREGLQGLGVKHQRDDREGLARLEAQLQRVRHEVLSREGDVWTELSEITRAEGIDLIVVGTHGRTGASKLLMGSVAETIFRHAPCPVLTVGPEASGEPDSIVDLHEILFPTDFSEESLAALPYAISLAQQDDARLYLLYVAGKSQRGETLLESQLRNLVPPDAKLFCEPKVFVETGPPAERILELAEELGTDLIVLGVKSTPLVFEASAHLPQATAYKVVSHATCPVLTVRGK
jgi:nucleotide-binding universal stress UspA family protein